MNLKYKPAKVSESRYEYRGVECFRNHNIVDGKPMSWDAGNCERLKLVGKSLEDLMEQIDNRLDSRTG